VRFSRIVAEQSSTDPPTLSYGELVKEYDVTYVAGGAAQNAARAAAVRREWLLTAVARLMLLNLLQYVLPEKHVVYVGAVGKDQLADQLRSANDKVSQSESSIWQGKQLIIQVVRVLN
jgi:sugar/nucleoside kinase (ribokinase family)